MHVGWALAARSLSVIFGYDRTSFFYDRNLLSPRSKGFIRRYPSLTGHVGV
jgi:hypothetical protein